MKASISQGSKSCPFLAVLHTRYIEYFADKIFSLSLIRSLSTECNLPKFTFEISAEFAEIWLKPLYLDKISVDFSFMLSAAY